MQAELFYNKEFMGLLVSQMISEVNLVMKAMYVECLTEVIKNGRATVVQICIKDACFSNASLICITQLTDRFHKEFEGDERLEKSYIDLVVLIIWCIGILLAEDAKYKNIFLELDCVTTILEVITKLGDQIYEKYYKELS